MCGYRLVEFEFWTGRAQGTDWYKRNSRARNQSTSGTERARWPQLSDGPDDDQVASFRFRRRAAVVLIERP
jgi:hypothetical protein